jgi:hypothetical protein
MPMIQHSDYKAGRNNALLILLAMACCIWSLPASAQQASASLDTTQYRIGEWIPLHLEVTTPKNTQITWPLIDNHIEELEVLRRTEIDSIQSDQATTWKQILTLTAFDSGFYAIPAFDFIIENDTVSTRAMVLRIHSVDIDTSQLDIKPIKEPIEAPLTFKEILPYLLGALGLIALLILAYILWKKRKQRPIAEVAQPEITIPPHEWAEQELQKLKREKLWEHGETKAYYIRLTDILRRYIELRYHQPAMESTTDEIMARLAILSLGKPLLEKVRATLVLSDLVKFAKAKPLENEHIQCFETVEQFVRETRAVIAKKEEES